MVINLGDGKEKSLGGLEIKGNKAPMTRPSKEREKKKKKGLPLIPAGLGWAGPHLPRESNQPAELAHNRPGSSPMSAMSVSFFPLVKKRCPYGVT